MDVMTTTTAAPPLSPAERCDRCGARAIVRAVLPGGGDLLFCAHHGREHAAKLREVAVEIHDDTNALGSNAPGSAEESSNALSANDKNLGGPSVN